MLIQRNAVSVQGQFSLTVFVSFCTPTISDNFEGEIQCPNDIECNRYSTSLFIYNKDIIYVVFTFDIFQVTFQIGLLLYNM